MNTTTRLAAFGVALVAVVAVGVGLGAAVGPDAPPAKAEAPAPIGAGVVATAEGYRLVPDTTELAPPGGTWHFATEDQAAVGAGIEGREVDRPGEVGVEGRVDVVEHGELGG